MLIPWTYPQNLNLDCVATSDPTNRLFLRAVAGDELAFAKIFQLHYRGLCAYATRLVSRRELAEEIVGDVFCSLWTNREKIRIHKSFYAYLVVCVHNRSLDCIRSLRRERMMGLDDADGIKCTQSIAHEMLVLEDLRETIDHAISALPPQCRAIFKLSREQDLTYKEIAHALKISVKTVDTQICRALKNIRRKVHSL